jgi:chromosome segregation protein
LHLKTLTLVGFKSFADRTRLDCEPGVTVVVGPNGVGKSNLVDAVAWVMGSQATRLLRTQRMDEVIFGGTALRPALGRSEVSLTFDNSDGALPLDLAEVTVTRRLFRDGTSDYEINGTACRLLDIQELLADSGVGRHQHVIVGQGRVDAILNAGPEEHRAVLEEAAGVIKHRQRRDRSLRRLEATDADVRRLQDLLTEQQRRMRPLKRQARAAERRDALHEEWRSLRLWIGGQEVRGLSERKDAVAAATTAAEGWLSEATTELAKAGEMLRSLQQTAGETGRALQRDTSGAARLETICERLRRIAMVARERRAGLESRLEGTGQRRTDLEQEREDLRARIAAATEEERTARELAERHEMTMRALADEERSLAEQGQLPAEGVAASLRGELAALESAASRDEGEVIAIEERRRVVTDRIASDRSEIDSVGSEHRAAESEAGPALQARQQARERLAAEEQALESAVDEFAGARMAEAAARGRVEALEAVISGMGDPAARRRAERLPGVIGPVVARLDMPDALAAAVEAALGPWADALVAEDLKAVSGSASALKSAGMGGVAFVAADGTEPSARAIAAEAGADALADLLGPGADAALAATLLGDVVLVEGWSTAWSLVRRYPQVRAVTSDGDLVTSYGVVAAHPEGAGSAALESARVDLERSETEAARAQSRFHAASRGRDAAVESVNKAEAVAAALEERLGRSEADLHRLERDLGEAEAEMARLDARRGALSEAAVVRTERLTRLRPQLDAFEGEEAARQAAWEALVHRREDVAARRESARRSLEAAAAALAAAMERRHLLESRLDEVYRLLSDLAEERVSSSDIEHLATIEERAHKALEASRNHLGTLRERQRDLRRRTGMGDRRLEEVQSRKEELEETIAARREELSMLAIEAAELRVRAESVAEGLRRDVDCDEDTALGAPQPEIPEDVDAAEHLASLEAQLKRIGPVNPLAAAEYRELAERAEFLAGQLEDLEASRRDLRKVISALDEEIGRLFKEAADEVARYFEENAGLMFPGGRGRLTLTDGDDLLNCGVDIHVQPMGKRIERLSMLSGGERSMAALAFLFAVFRARPSPFYVLDEVEAALDDANLRRFIRLVGTLRETSQLVIVTHQQKTMEAADILYGVTMEPGETSRVLAKRLTKV